MKSCILAIVLMLVGCTIEVANPVPPIVAQAGATNQPQKLGCGIVLRACNCDATSATPGLITTTDKCDSGAQVFSTCGYCNNGGYAWYSMCYCQ